MELEVEWAKVKAQQDEKSSFRVVHECHGDLVVNKRETNMQLSLELRKVHKEKKVGRSGEATKDMKT